LQFTGCEGDLCLDGTDKPEFDHWRWGDFWYPLEHVVTFKRGVYGSALRHLAPFARQIAGQQAIPPLRPEARPRPPARRQSGQRGRGG
jgi:putative (di)nucleoside polyphosphate hydrolase